MSATPDELPMLTVGLRFKRGDARILRNLIERMESEGIATENIMLFRQALDAVEKDEPLTVGAGDLDEVRAMAAGFSNFGLSEPSIESLSGLHLGG